MHEDKKEYLMGYQLCKRRIARIEDEISELRDMKMSISVQSDGMPRGSEKSDLSSYAAKLDEMERRLLKERYNLIKTYTAIRTSVDSLEDEKQRAVLFYHYIRGMSWGDVAEKIGCSDRWVFRLHGKALNNLKILK